MPLRNASIPLKSKTLEKYWGENDPTKKCMWPIRVFEFTYFAKTLTILPQLIDTGFSGVISFLQTFLF
jgi:hypothetical protein